MWMSKGRPPSGSPCNEGIAVAVEQQDEQQDGDQKDRMENIHHDVGFFVTRKGGSSGSSILGFWSFRSFGSRPSAGFQSIVRRLLPDR